MFAVCAGFQLLGTTYEAGDGDILDGLGLLDLETRAGEGRLIGECLVTPAAGDRTPRAHRLREPRRSHDARARRRAARRA